MTTDTITIKDIDAKLLEIRDLIDGILADVRENPGDFNEAINFADLRCVDVGLCRSLDGHEHWLAHIEEADPACPKLAQHVAEAIFALTGITVEIDTSW